ncbi:hypothetical protein ACQKP3_17600 [Vibrio sp. DNB22_10_4]
MSTKVKLYSGESRSPLCQASLEFYQLSMLLDELSSEIEVQECDYARVDVYEGGHLVRSYRTCSKTRVERLLHHHWQ